MRLRAVLLLSTLILLPACEPDECSVNFTLGGAIDYQYAWRYPSTDCGVRSTPSTVPAGIEFETSGNSLEITSGTALTVGSHTVEVMYRTIDGNVWSTDPYEGDSVCLMTISASEVVDWVHEDHRRIAGLVDCTGELLINENGEEPLTVTGLLFNIYTADNGYY